MSYVFLLGLFVVGIVMGIIGHIAATRERDRRRRRQEP